MLVSTTKDVEAPTRTLVPDMTAIPTPEIMQLMKKYETFMNEIISLDMPGRLNNLENEAAKKNLKKKKKSMSSQGTNASDEMVEDAEFGSDVKENVPRQSSSTSSQGRSPPQRRFRKKNLLIDIASNCEPGY